MSGEITSSTDPRSLWSRAIHVAALIGLCLAGLSLCARWLWIGNILNHVSAHLLLLTLVLVPLVRKRPASAALVVLSICLWSWPWLYQAYEQRAEHHAQASAVTFMTANTAWWNKEDPQAVAQRIIEANPDFCVVVEVHPEIAQVLRKSPQWHSRIGKSKIGPYSMLLLSRLDIVEQKVHVIPGTVRDLDMDMEAAVSLSAEQQQQFANKDLLLFEVVVKFPNGKLMRVIAAHPPSPIVPRLLQDRNNVLQRIANLTQASAEPCLLIGDLNMVPASVEWRALHRLGYLRPGGPQKRTWFLKSFLWLRQIGLAIDYIAATEGVSLSPLSYVRIPGSDHLAISSAVSLP